MIALLNCLKTRVVCRKGQGLVEYGMIIGLVAVIVVTALTVLREPLENFFQAVGEYLGANSINPPSGS